jgi:hypothetical protein
VGSVRDIAPAWLSFVRASEWGCVWKRPAVSERQGDPETFIHHTGGGRLATDHHQAMRSLQAIYHERLNYSTIAYDMNVHLNTSDNTVAIMGAREGWLSAATKDRNDIGEAICLFGYFHPGHRLSEQPTDREIEALAFAVAWSIEMGWSAGNTQVLGHRDNPAHRGATACPGDFLYPHISWIERRAYELLWMANQPPPAPPKQSEDDTDMTTTPRPRRPYDSRDGNAPFKPGETRQIIVGKSDLSEVFVNVTVLGLGGTAGHVSVNDPTGNTAVIGYNGDDRLESNGVPARVTNGKISVTNSVGNAHVILDVFAEK